MAKAQFHKNQRVYVKPVGTWAIIERVLPQWAKGLDEPLRIFYDVGLGREFSAEELQAEQIQTLDIAQMPKETWRIVRARNKWQPEIDCKHHPFPGSYPVVMTGETDWGGWRVPGAEYDLDPRRIEGQSRLIATAPKLLAIAAALTEIAARATGDESQEVIGLAEDARRLIKFIEG
ncbi:MAG: hypothetical protein GC199_07170 [Alphaproteobacteria bacterium]|nr:hypothetical protein [Alphaproteobacteria bacterium]